MIKWLVAIVVLSGSTANAEDAMTHVQVKFVFDAHELTRLWEPSDFTTHETTLAAHIDEVLSIGPFRAWSISPDSSTHQVVLSFRLTDESLGLGFEIDAEGDRGRLLAATMKEPWLTATEFSRKVPYPQEEAVDDIKAALDDLLEKHRTSLESYLQEVVALTNDSGVFANNAVTGELELILPLDWNAYATLRKAQFLIMCTQTGVGEVQVITNGRGRSETFHATPAFEAIVTKPMQRISDGAAAKIESAVDISEVRRLEMGPVFLLRPARTVGGFLSADQ